MAQDTDPQDHAEAHSTWHLCWQAAVGREFFPVPSLHDRIRDRVVEAHRGRGRVLLDFCIGVTEVDPARMSVLRQRLPGTSRRQRISPEALPSAPIAVLLLIAGALRSFHRRG